MQGFFFLSDLLSASFQTVNRHARRLWNGPHTTSWDSVFQCRGRRKKPNFTPLDSSSPGSVRVITPASNEGRSVCRTLSCSSEFPHLSYVAFDDAFKSGEEKKVLLFWPCNSRLKHSRSVDFCCFLFSPQPFSPISLVSWLHSLLRSFWWRRCQNTLGLSSRHSWRRHVWNS